MKQILFLMLCVVLVSCSKTKVTDLEYKDEGWDCYVYQEDKPFDGVAWSVDGKSYKIYADCGLLKKIEYYSEDGKLFCVVENEEKKFYNDNGRIITREQARELYRDKYWHWKDLQRSLNNIARHRTRHILDSLLNKVQDIAREKQRVALEENPVAIQNAITGRAFMDKIKQEEGVVTTESGLAYKVVKAGNGPCPETTDRVTVKYKGMLIDESVFDENAEGVEFPVTGVIPGFSEGLKLMSKGSIYRLYIPTELAYGINGPQTIGPNQTLIFDVELIDIKK